MLSASFVRPGPFERLYRDGMSQLASRRRGGEGGHQAGKVDLLNLLDAQRTLTRALLFLVESLKDMNVARATPWLIVGPELTEGGRIA